MDSISLTGLEVVAKHGVYAAEKIHSQKFIFDINLALDFLAAVQNDDLAQTVNYAQVAQLVSELVENNSFNLIETLAYRIGKAILVEFPMVAVVQVTVHKPEAPLEYSFNDVAVSISLQR